MIIDEQLKQLSPTGSQPGIIYGLPKVHKTSIPLRPILSAIGSHSYNLPKFLILLLCPLSLGPYLVILSLSFRIYFP